MIESLRLFLSLQGVTPQARKRLEAKLPDWERRLLARGVSEIPDLRLADKWTPEQFSDYVEVMAIFTQEAQAAHKPLGIPRKLERMLAQHAHQFRDMSGVRVRPEPEQQPARLRLIGYWASDSSAEWPVVNTWIDRNWEPRERDAVIEWLSSGERVIQWLGWSKCRVCGCNNGDTDLSDGVYLWPDGLLHYVRSHHIRMPRAFIDRAVEHPGIPRNALRHLEIDLGEDVDRDWWKSQRPDWAPAEHSPKTGP